MLTRVLWKYYRFDTHPLRMELLYETFFLFVS